MTGQQFDFMLFIGFAVITIVAAFVAFWPLTLVTAFAAGIAFHNYRIGKAIDRRK